MNGLEGYGDIMLNWTVWTYFCRYDRRLERSYSMSCFC